MKTPRGPIHLDLILVGGGHTHALILKKLGMMPWDGVRVVLVSNVTHTPYSGMLPGMVSGHYQYDESHIDLRKLCEFAGAQFILDEMQDLDLKEKRVFCKNHPPFSYDLLSLNTGSLPLVKSSHIPGSCDFGTPIKPVPAFLQKWNAILKNKKNLQSGLTLIVVGGGVGGVELAFNMKERLGEFAKIHLLQRGEEILPYQPKKMRLHLTALLREKGVQVHVGFVIADIKANEIREEGGKVLQYDELFWITEATSPSWVKDSGLQVDEKGFIEVFPTLQSVSHPDVFAAGDLAQVQGFTREKNGVMAVRQAPALFDNLQRRTLGKPLRPFHPQKKFLVLLGTGDKKVYAGLGSWSFYSPLLWNLKDWIDRRFMKGFQDLSLGDSAEEEEQGKLGALQELQKKAQMRCLGCAAKVGSPILKKVLGRLQSESPKKKQSSSQVEILYGLEEEGDGAVISLSPSKNSLLLVQSLDYFPSPLADPYLLGRITVNHCLSDLWAMGADAHSALSLVLLPFMKEKCLEETLYQTLSGVIAELTLHGATLIGGHTAEGSDLALGLLCNGFVAPGEILRKKGMQEGDALILTKAIGTGTLLAAHRRLQAKGRWIDGAVLAMLNSNEKASRIFRQSKATACTDITGFGLINHLAEMVKASKVKVSLQVDSLFFLEGARETVTLGILSSLYDQNRQGAGVLSNVSLYENHPLFPLLFDPQTSGGLLASVPEHQVALVLKELHLAGYPEARRIGTVHSSWDPSPLISHEGPITLRGNFSM